MRHIFIIGSRGLPAKYGGFETFVEALVTHQLSSQLKYHVACLSDEKTGEHFTFRGADCFTINPPKLGPARVMAYDMMAIHYALSYIKEQQIEHPIFYILGNTIGRFMKPFAKKIRAVGGTLLVNPDGLEWRRSKWSKPVQFYLKQSEKVMTQVADFIIADNEGIEDYIKISYPWSKTRFIAYGTETKRSSLTRDDARVRSFYDKWGTKEGDYYLIVGRFVPENNYEVMLKEFKASQTRRKLLLVCNHEGNPYVDELAVKTDFQSDPRIHFVGTVYDKELLAYIRESAYAYIHGHEVGGTNPGLLEALAHTNVNLILGVDFNQKVAQQTALYWSKEEGNLKTLIESVDANDFKYLGSKARKHVDSNYTWEKIVGEYEELFLNES
ncbi:beta 1-4 rhamnosyltransferase Cps2T [Streptococcus pluranimalium]|uniref:beta 1-4 rhamnosyltransferase Cps2T n=1 Tax=Streptococcus pluranimalium TaxID=82348 RepID=UPI003F681F9E